MYLKKSQSEKPCLYEIPYDKDDLANIFFPDKEETLTLEQESRSKLNKDKVKPYYTKQNSLYEIFKPPSREYLDQLAHANEVRKKTIPKPSVLGKLTTFLDSLERKSFTKTKSIPKTNVSEGLSKPVATQILPQNRKQAVRNTNVIKPGMYRIDTRTTQTRAPQLPRTSRNTNPRVSTSTGLYWQKDEKLTSVDSFYVKRLWFNQIVILMRSVKFSRVPRESSRSACVLIKGKGWFGDQNFAPLGIWDLRLCACHVALAVLHDALRALVDMLLVAMLIEDVSLVMSTLAYVDSETITRADGAQSSRVPVPLHDDPYVAVRQAQLVDTDTESDP
ncbi:hypothetical protein Tco_1031653 [Tanacetum coccineum]|uniref:Uncharacterized protein n=1 Tax=Tanacetum coccineum TaxID=301880 RepID=A0ABQ5GBW3_9ASTR